MRNRNAMKLDYDFIKQILLTMEEYDKHEIENLELMKYLNIADEDVDKFIGHILSLGDNGMVDTNNLKHPYGFARISSEGVYQIVRDKYRITAQGYEFLDVLKNDTVLKKIKNFTIKNALEIGNQLIIESAKINMM